MIDVPALKQLGRILHYYNFWIPRCSPDGRTLLDRDVSDSLDGLRRRMRLCCPTD